MNHAHRMDEKNIPDISENPSKLTQKKLVTQQKTFEMITITMCFILDKLRL